MHAGPPSTASYKTSIKEDSLIEVMEYLIDNIYIKVGNKVFRHQVEIPMGTDCTPLLGLDKLCSKFYLLFFSFMLKMSTYYSFYNPYYSCTLILNCLKNIFQGYVHKT